MQGFLIEPSAPCPRNRMAWEAWLQSQSVSCADSGARACEPVCSSHASGIAAASREAAEGALVGRYDIHQGVALLVENGVARQGKRGRQLGRILDSRTEGTMGLGVALEGRAGRKVS
jgi:hypothetical protein